jgi:hypothetical protein
VYYTAKELTLQQLRSPGSAKLIAQLYEQVVRRFLSAGGLALPLQRALPQMAPERDMDSINATIDALFAKHGKTRPSR